MTSPHSGGQRAFAAHPALMALACCLLGGGFLKGHTAQAQDGRPAELPRPGYRELAPGVLTVIPPTSPADMSAANVFRQQEFFEITLGNPPNWKPNEAAVSKTLLGQATARREGGSTATYGYPFQHAVWCLEFAYKPPRQIDIDVPVEGGRMQRTRVWYLVYRVRNVGGLKPKAGVGNAEELQQLIDAGTFEPDALKASGTQLTEAFEEAVRFLPHFVLQTEEAVTPREGLAAYRGYLDRVIPGAAEAIQAREDPARPLHDSVSISEELLQPGEERWGVAVWDGVDPRIDLFTIFIKGLTNRFASKVTASADLLDEQKQPADNGLALILTDGDRFAMESLRLDFWRRGDDVDGRPMEMMVGSTGLSPRMALGTFLAEAASRAVVTRAAPTTGLSRLGITWQNLLDGATGDPLEPGHAVSLRPLVVLLEALAAVEADTQERAADEVLGMVAADDLFTLLRSLESELPGEAAAARAAVLEQLGLAIEEGSSLKSLAELASAIDQRPEIAQQQAIERAVFGDLAGAFERVAAAARRGRAVAVLESLRLDLREMAQLGSLGAFDRLRERLDAIAGGLETDDGGEWPRPTPAVISGIFGSEGPAIYEEAVSRTPGIDYEWVFQYEK
ncbi:MAG: hypothetical protein ISQ70_00425 [Pirellulales bacterium]|nr:hypothetical protein [Pirellulales bacterium]